MHRMSLHLAVGSFLACAHLQADEPFSSTPSPFAWTTDGPVERFVQDGDRIYVTGSFRLVGRPTGTFARVDSATGTSIEGPLVNGTVTAIEPDGNGGTFISGSFDRVGGLVRKRFAHVLADGSVGPFQLETEGTAQDIVVHNGVIYVAGDNGFGKEPAAPRYGLAAFDATTGQLLPWNPIPTTIDKPVTGESFECLSVRGSELWVGGKFDCRFGTADQRRNFVALDLATAAATGWDPSPNDVVLDLEDFVGGVLFAGNFTSFAGVPRSKVALVDSVTHAVSTFETSINSTVFDVAVSGFTVYVAGQFSMVEGQPRSCAAALDATGQLLAFDPQISGGDGDGPIVRRLVVDAGDVYLSGCFANAGADRRWCLARVDGITGAAQAWTCHVGGPEASHATEMMVSQGDVLLGGNFTMVEGRERFSFAAIDLTTEELEDLAPRFTTSSSPDEPGTTFDVAPFADRLIVSGSFQRVNGIQRPKLVAIDRTSGDPVSTFDAGITPSDNGAFDVEVVNGTLFATNLGGADDLAALDPWTGAKLDMGANEIETSLWVRSLASSADGTTLFWGGGFNVVSTGGPSNPQIVSRGFGASINTSTFALDAWNPDLNAPIRQLVRVGGSLYAGGEFEFSGPAAGTPIWRRRVCEFDVASGALTPFAPVVDNGLVTTLTASGKYLFVGGTFSKINGISHPRLAAIDRATGSVASWTPSFSGSITALLAANDRLFVGCNTGFLQFAGNVQAAMGVFRIDSLTSPTKTISLTTGGSQVLNVHAGHPRASQSFWILGSASGTSPSFDLAGVRVPLALDAYTMLTATTPFFVFIGNPGVLDQYGDGTSTFVLPPGLSPSLAGWTIHHSAITYDPIGGVPTFATMPLGVTLVP